MTGENLKKGSDLLTEVIVQGMQEKKGEDIVILNLKNIQNSIADYFVICTGTSSRHVDAVANSVEKEVLDTLKEKPVNVEGKQVAEWVLMDYVDVVVHIFQKEIRTYYNLEGLWGDAEMKEVDYNKATG